MGVALGLAGCGESLDPAQGAEGLGRTPEPLGSGLAGRAPALGDLSELAPEARELLEAAAAGVDRDPGRSEAWRQLGMALHAYRRFGLAADAYAQSLARVADDARTQHCAGLVFEQLGREDEARQAFEAAARIAPSYPPAYWRLALLQLGAGEPQAAEASLVRALEVAPFDAAANVTLARVHLQSGREAAAVDVLEAHLERNPRDDNARYLLGTALRAVGRAQEAARALAAGKGGEALRDDPWEREVLALRKGYRTDFLRALERLEQGQVDEAARALEDLFRREPEDTLIHIALHRAYRRRGELDRAIDLLLEARRLEPLQDTVHLHLAGTLQEKAHADGAVDRSLLALALKSIETACELSPSYATAHALHGDVLLDLGREPEAVAAWVRAADFERTNPLWFEKASLGLCRLGRWADAVPYLEQLDVLRPDAPATLLYLSAALANSGRLEEAARPLERARELAPEDATIRQAVVDLREKRREAGG